MLTPRGTTIIHHDIIDDEATSTQTALPEQLRTPTAAHTTDWVRHLSGSPAVMSRTGDHQCPRVMLCPLSIRIALPCRYAECEWQQHCLGDVPYPSLDLIPVGSLSVDVPILPVHGSALSPWRPCSHGISSPYHDSLRDRLRASSNALSPPIRGKLQLPVPFPIHKCIRCFPENEDLRRPSGPTAGQWRQTVADSPGICVLVFGCERYAAVNS